jgi:hypothetical protein
VAPPSGRPWTAVNRWRHTDTGHADRCFCGDACSVE